MNTQPMGQVWTTAARIVQPNTEEKLPVYMDFGPPRAIRDETTSGPLPPATISFAPGREEFVIGDRYRIMLPAKLQISFASLMNAFPASYWQAWTVVSKVRLRLVLTGDVTAVVYRSTASGRRERVERTQLVGADHEVVTFDLPLKHFVDGGWYWFDLIAATPSILEEGEWQVAGEAPRPGKLSIGITTFNKPDYCTANLKAIGLATSLLDRIDKVYVVDQGNRLVVDDEGYAEAAALLGEHLSIVYQANLGGAGGFARGMYETAIAGQSVYHLVLDDDVEIEPEGIERALVFAGFCRNLTVVGGMMFDLADKSVMLSLGESVDRYSWRWGSADGLPENVDLATSPLRSTPWMHRRVTVDYNGWWMCLIPADTIRQIGLSLPVFIKWDDLEYGLRAQEAGVPTVTLPGAAVWHMSWSDKNDLIDWQAYYHEKNRLISCMLYSRYHFGGKILPTLLARDFKHLVSSEYYAQELRILALQDLLSGPEHLHQTIGERLPMLRKMMNEYDQTTYLTDPADMPEIDRSKPFRKGRAIKAPAAPLLPVWGLKSLIHQLLPVPRSAEERPQRALAAGAADMFSLSAFDSVLVTKADGRGVSWYKRDPKVFRSQMAREAVLRAELVRRWPELARQYREAFPELVSFAAWEKTFGIEAHDGVEAKEAYAERA